MSGILEKLDSYQILTNLLPGVFFGLTLSLIFGLTIQGNNVGEDIVLFYFMGLIINRIGSLIVEPFLKKIGLVRFAPYSDFVKGVHADSKIDTLSEMNNYTRSLLTCVLLLPIIKGLHVLYFKWTWFFLNWEWCAVAFLIALFLLAYRKQTNYVRKRVEVVNNFKAKEIKAGG